MWCHAYDHTMDLLYGHTLMCGSFFKTRGKLKGKIVKLKETPLEDGDKMTDEDKAMNHVRKCSEWGHNVLTEAIHILRVKIPTENPK